MYYKVKEVSEMVGISVRTLHHYDKIGLLKPHHKDKESGYRQYSEANLVSLQQICFFKELDFSLSEIKHYLEDETIDIGDLLDKHKTLMEKKVERLLKIIDTIDRTKTKNERGEIMSHEELFDGFDMSEIEAHKAKYAEEVEAKWGGSDAFAQSKARTDKYTPGDWKRIQEKTNGTYRAMVSMMEKGIEVSDDRVQELTGKLRDYITEDFYDCTMEIFEGLGQMYVNDPRFEKNLNKHGDGFAKYLSDAVAEYCK